MKFARKKEIVCKKKNLIYRQKIIDRRFLAEMAEFSETLQKNICQHMHIFEKKYNHRQFYTVPFI